MERGETSTAPKPAQAKQSPWRLLAQKPFRYLWLANLVSFVGTWINDVGAGWAMASMDPDPLLVSLVQVANTAPLFILALPAGALADSFDRRSMLLAAQFWLLLSAASMAWVSYTGNLTPMLLVLLTLCLGLGGAFSSPAWQATVPLLVDRKDLVGAVTLGSISVNVARAIGPMIGGLLVSAQGPWAAFMLNAVSFAYVFLTLLLWKPQPGPRPRRESLTTATLAGLRYLRHSKPLRKVYRRSLAFVLPSSALWALIPVLVKIDLKLSAGSYGAVLTSVGVGAVVMVGFLDKLRERLGVNRMLLLAALLFASCLALLPLADHTAPLCAIGVVLGGCWLCCLSSYQAVVQTRVPGWVRARALSVYSIVFFGGLSAGSLLWGTIARTFGTQTALWAAAASLAILSLTSSRLKVPEGEIPDLSPSGTWPVPSPPCDQSKPVQVVVEYRVDPAAHKDFLPLLDQMGTIRRRDGGYHWSVSQDRDQPHLFYEIFYSASWAEHMDMHQRFTRQDEELQARLLAYLEQPLRIRHLSVRLD